MSETPRYPTVHLDVARDEADEVAASLFEAGATGVEERDAETLDRAEGAEMTLVAHFATDDEARVIVEAFARYEARYVPIVGDEWRDGWKAFFKPVRIGRLVVLPSWESVDPQPDDVLLSLDPGQAFGTGTHETTRLVLEEVVSRVKGGERVLDVGTGSGILAIAAIKLGAARARAVDNDPIAVTVARENAAINRVASRVRASITPIRGLRGRYDLVLANIRGPVLTPLARSLSARVAPGGTLVLSGILLDEEAAIREAYDPWLGEPTLRSENDWVAVTYQRRA